MIEALFYILVSIVSMVIKLKDLEELVGFLAYVPSGYLFYYPFISWIYWAYCNVFYSITDDFFIKQNEIYSVKFNSFSQNKARIDKNQEYFECCGWEGPEDYYEINRNYSLIPKSCWKNKQKFESLSDIYSIGCKNKILPFLFTNSNYVQNYFHIAAMKMLILIVVWEKNKQHGFLPGKSTMDAIIKLVDDMSTAKDNKESILIF
ncbi:unnamed protein product [Brachionus calyciflorus]|uniref:Uncharacterized protein n=1 Tax=Brachionus calyciflorus TaxID=104777 RepID=A0A813QJ65_9BILA|nr:unnamed protein product [Brachionus calyciflorus]